MATSLSVSDLRRVPYPDPATAQPAWLSLLRLSSLECRVAPRVSPSAACDLIDPSAGAEVYAEALARALPDLMTRRPVIWAPGAAGRSFDEDWLNACRNALLRGDGDSFRFLTTRRLTRGSVPIFRMLLSGLGERLDKF
ncbi:MAG: hypothetical protein AAF390_10665 [Pseudomonadota bacterium]